MSVESAGILDGVGEVHRVMLASDRLTAEFLTHGARLRSIRLDDGPNMAVTTSSLSEFAGDFVHHGPVIVPVGNRIKGARAEIEGRTFTFEANQSGRHTLHSGKAGGQWQIWAITESDSSSVTMRLGLEDGAGGFPGNRDVTATYRLEGPTLYLTITATTDAATLFNPAHHGYWNLDGSAEWAGHTLEVPAEHVLAIDDETLPTGEIAPVSGPLDLRRPVQPSSEIDHNYCFEAEGLRVRLSAPSGRAMEIASDAPGLQVYTGNSAGIALEPQHWPDAPHHPSFPSILLRPGDTFTQSSAFTFTAP